MSRHLIRFSMIFVLAAVLVLPFTPVMSSTVFASGGCNTAVDNPHFSVGANGVIAKTRVNCYGGTGRYDYVLKLFVCVNKPPANFNPKINNTGCTRKSLTNGTIYFTPTTSETRYIPESGQPGARGTGWWIASNEWRVDFGNEITTLSPSVQISAP